MSRDKVIVMLGVRPDSKEKGGIYSVLQAFRAGGLFERWPIHYIGTVASGSHLSKLRVLAQALGEFVSLAFTGRLALLHAQTSTRASFWRKSIFIAIALMARRPAILHLHGSEFERFYRDECGTFRKWLIRSVLSRVDRVIVLSSQWQQMIQTIAPAAKVVKIFNPAPVAESATALAQVERASNVLLFLGRFGARKGIFDLLQALTVVRTRFPDVQLRCGGDGDVDGVRARAAELGLQDCVHVLGWVSGEAKERELARATMYVLPSHAEGLPMGILEAMAAGAPVVATPIGGIPDAIEDGVDGFLTTPGDTEMLADRIIRLLGSSELQSAFAAAARRKVRNQFSRETVLSQLESLYASLGAQPYVIIEGKRIANAEQRSCA